MKHLGRVLLVILGLLWAAGCHRQKPASTLNLFAWSEYVPQEVIDGFTRETGIHVNYESYGSNEAMLTKLARGSSRYDLIQPSEYMVEHLIRRGMLEPLDFSRLPNIKNLDPAFRDLPYDPGQKYSVPYMAGTVGIVVNAERVKNPVRGYRDVFQEKFNKRIVAIDDNREIVSWALDVLGIPVNDVTTEKLLEARPLLERWAPLVRDFATDDPKPSLVTGDCDLGIIYSGDAAKLYEASHKFQYVLPIEGVHEFIDNLCIPKGAPHKAAAEAFINYVLRPEVSKLISDKFPYTNPNAAARKLLSREQLENPASYPNARQMEIFHDIGPAAQEIGKMMTQIRSRS